MDPVVFPKALDAEIPPGIGDKAVSFPMFPHTELEKNIPRATNSFTNKAFRLFTVKRLCDLGVFCHVTCLETRELVATSGKLWLKPDLWHYFLGLEQEEVVFFCV